MAQEMADHVHREIPDDIDTDEALARELVLLGALLRRRARAEREPPDPSFVESLWGRLVYGEGLDPADDRTKPDRLEEDTGTRRPPTDGDKRAVRSS